MTDAQTEARAIWDAATEADMLADGDPVEIIATALAAKDAERDGWKKTATEYATELQAARHQLAEANKALDPFARIADDYTDEEDDDFQVWKDFDVLGATLPLKHFRAARRALEAQGGENAE